MPVARKISWATKHHSTSLSNAQSRNAALAAKSPGSFSIIVYQSSIVISLPPSLSSLSNLLYGRGHLLQIELNDDLLAIPDPLFQLLADFVLVFFIGDGPLNGVRRLECDGYLHNSISFE